MSVLLQPRKLTVAEYLEIERAAEYKSEFFDGVMYPLHLPERPGMMAGASPRHNFIRENISVEIGIRLKGTRCRALSADQRVKVDRANFYTYPDVLIICGEPQFDPNDECTLINPIAIFEVLSPSTEKYDRGAKFRNYQTIPSLQEYVLVVRDEPIIERFTRQTDGTWQLQTIVGLDATLVLTAVPVQIPLADIYAGIVFPQAS